jgi:UDP-glucose 4-epimerase
MDKKPCVAITGIAGFIGSNLAELLIKEGYRVIGIDNLSYGKKDQVAPGVDFRDLDILSKDIYPVFKECDFVFHFAAKNCISDCQKDPVGTSNMNVTGTVNVFEAASQAKVKKVIYAESSALYEGVNVFPTPETKIAPQSFYAISKACGNIFAEGYQKFRRLTTVGLRYFNVYGPKQDYRRTIPPVMSAFIIKLLKEERSIIYGNGAKRRDFIHVDDINDFHLLCLKTNKVDNKVFNLGSGKNYSVLEIYKIITKLLKTNIRPVFKPGLPGEAQINLADITQAKKLGWSPKISLEKGLEKMITYIRQEIKRGNIK